MTSFQAKQTLSVLGISNNCCCRNRGRAHLVWQREEIIIKPESTQAGNEALGPGLSTLGFGYTFPSHTLLICLDTRRISSPSRESEGPATYKFVPSSIISCTSWEDAMAKRLLMGGPFSVSGDQEVRAGRRGCGVQWFIMGKNGHQ